MSLYRDLRRLARPLRRMLPRRPNLYDSAELLSYVRRKRDGLLHQADRIETVALVSSVADYAFLPEVSDRAYNLGLTSSDFHATYHQYRYLQKNLPRLHNIILFAPVFAPGYALQSTNERYRAIAYRHFFDIPLLDHARFDPRHVARIERRCQATIPPDLPPDYLGYERKSYYGVDISARVRTDTHLRENLREPDQMIWLERLLTAAAQASQRVLLVIPPYRSDDKAELAKSLDRRALFGKYHALQHDCLQLLDFYDSPEFDDSCMGDTDHRNEAGAQRLTPAILRHVPGVTP